MRFHAPPPPNRVTIFGGTKGLAADIWYTADIWSSTGGAFDVSISTPIGKTFKLWGLGFIRKGNLDDRIRVWRVTVPQEVLAEIDAYTLHEFYTEPKLAASADFTVTVRLQVLCPSQLGTKLIAAYMIFSID